MGISQQISVATLISLSASLSGCSGRIHATDTATVSDGATRRSDGGNDADDATGVTHGVAPGGDLDASNVADGAARGGDGGSLQITCLSPNARSSGRLSAHTSGDVTCIPAGIGLQLDCFATAMHPDGSTGDVTDTAVWQSSAPATALPSGVTTIGTATQPYEAFTINGAGSATITATLEGAVSNMITTSAVIESLNLHGNECAGSGALAVVSPMGTCSPGLIKAGMTDPFAVVAGYTTTGTCTASESMFDVTSLATWSTVNPAIATVSNTAGSNGLVTGVTAGTTGLAATFGGEADTFNLTVLSN